MLTELAIRFIVGGILVSVFAVIGGALKPKSFAGIFGAAPSVALASLALTFATEGGSHAALEGRSMLAGAIALFAYSLLVGWLLTTKRAGAPVATGASWLAWLAVAFSLWAAFLR